MGPGESPHKPQGPALAPHPPAKKSLLGTWRAPQLWLPGDLQPVRETQGPTSESPQRLALWDADTYLERVRFLLTPGLLLTR